MHLPASIPYLLLCWSHTLSIIAIIKCLTVYVCKQQTLVFLLYLLSETSQSSDKPFYRRCVKKCLQWSFLSVLNTTRLKTEPAYVQTGKALAQKFTAVENFLNLSPEIKVLHI